MERTHAAPPVRLATLGPWGLFGLLTVPLMVLALVVYSVAYTPLLFGDADWYATGLAGLLSDGPLYDPSGTLAWNATEAA